MNNLLKWPNIRAFRSINIILIFILSFSTCFGQTSYKMIVPTFLGNDTRNYYGNEAPDKLDVIWKTNLGCGLTIIPNANQDAVQMCGAGWTGQPLLVEDDGKLYIIQGAYDYNLRKIEAETGTVVWTYAFDDVIKGTGCIWVNPNKADNDPNKIVIFQGSRRGYKFSIAEKIIPSYRAISFRTGKELWRYNSVRGASYSRDVDGTALILDDTIFLGLETGRFVKLNPNPDSARILDAILQPLEYFSIDLYTQEDVNAHNGNVIIESAPSILRNTIYIASGAGYLYGYNRKTGKMDFKFKTGSDMDGSPIITRDSNILISVEKQYIPGKGGAMMINPKLHQDSCVVWYFPTEDFTFTDWRGGIIGSCATNDSYIKSGQNSLCAFVAIDGHLYVVENEFTDPDETVFGPCGKKKYPKPQLVFKYKTGISIATPIFFGNKLIVLTYDGIFMFEYDGNCTFKLAEKNTNIRGESTPIVHNKRLYVASRDGNLYCLGKKD